MCGGGGGGGRGGFTPTDLVFSDLEASCCFELVLSSSFCQVTTAPCILLIRLGVGEAGKT